MPRSGWSTVCPPISLPDDRDRVQLAQGQIAGLADVAGVDEEGAAQAVGLQHLRGRWRWTLRPSSKVSGDDRLARLQDQRVDGWHRQDRIGPGPTTPATTGEARDAQLDAASRSRAGDDQGGASLSMTVSFSPVRTAWMMSSRVVVGSKPTSRGPWCCPDAAAHVLVALAVSLVVGHQADRLSLPSTSMMRRARSMIETSKEPPRLNAWPRLAGCSAIATIAGTTSPT